MTIKTLKRVGRRLQEIKGDGGDVSRQQIELEVMQEVGVHPATIRLAIVNMLKLKILIPAGLGKYKISEKIEEEELW